MEIQHKMRQWPPSPIVEDEHVALAREITPQTTEATAVLSPGCIDQIPIIIASEDVEKSANTVTVAGVHRDIETSASGSEMKVDFSTPGMPTPPISDNEGRPQSHECQEAQFTRNHSSKPRSQSAMRASSDTNAFHRPTFLRIRTDMLGNSASAASTPYCGNESLSPYAWTPEASTHSVVSNTEPVSRDLDSSQYHSESLRTFAPAPAVRTDYDRIQDHGSRVLRDSENQSQKLFHSVNSAKATEKIPPSPRRSSTSIEKSQHVPANDLSRRSQTGHLAPPEINGHLRRRVEDYTTLPSPRQSFSYDHTARSFSGSREVRNPSSAEEVVKGVRSLYIQPSNNGGHDLGGRPLPHRTERPRLDDDVDHSMYSLDNKAMTSSDDATRRVYRIRDANSPSTSPSVHASNRVDNDYFTRAFHDAAVKSSGKHTPRGSFDRTNMHSPRTSPLQTPRPDRSPSAAHRYTPSSSPHHLTTPSRDPSVDGTQAEISRTSASLRSQVAAEFATVIQTSSPTTWAPLIVDTSAILPRSRGSSKPTSRASSPTRGVTPTSPRTRAFGQANRVSRSERVSVSSSARPCSRDVVPRRTSLNVPQAHQTKRHQTRADDNHQYEANDDCVSPLQRTPSISPALSGHASPLTQDRSNSIGDQREAQHVDASTISLPNCTRPQPSQGYRDWTSLHGMPFINLCPTCRDAIAQFPKYRSLLCRAQEKPYHKAIVCSLSSPWLRMAFRHCVTRGEPDLDIFKDIVILPTGCWPCAGDKLDIRKWWRLKDYSQNKTVPNFSACSACARRAHTIFPNLTPDFVDGRIRQEEVCSLHPGVRHWHKLMNKLAEADRKCRQRTTREGEHLQDLIGFLQDIPRHDSCERDRLVANKMWHLHPDIPDFTVCETCFNETVYPKRDRPIARNISATTKTVPASVVQAGSADGPPIIKAYSCQLYSDRMRQLLNDAVAGRISFDRFKDTVTQRIQVQHRLNDQNRSYALDREAGIDRSRELERNRILWRNQFE